MDAPAPAAAPADAELVAALRAGSGAAFGTLYARHRNAVRMAVLGSTGPGLDVDDVVQEAFSRAFERIGSLREPQFFRAWVVQIARNYVIDQRRSRGRRPTVSLSAEIDDGTAPEPVSADASPEEMGEFAETARALRVAMTGLSARDLTVLSMTVQLGFGPGDVADALGITANNAKVVLHRARRRLESMLAVEPA